jgi:hypothetical protein
MTHKSEENSSFEVLDVLFWGMMISPVDQTSFLEAYPHWQKMLSKPRFLCKFYNELFHTACLLSYHWYDTNNLIYI